MVFVAEIATVCVLLISFRKKKMPEWAAFAFVLLHFLFWTPVLWSETRIWLFTIYSRDLVLLLFPCSTVVYLWQRWKGSHPQDETAKGEKTPWRAALAVVSLLAFGAVWAPASGL
jgi:hypothetical protein